MIHDGVAVWLGISRGLSVGIYTIHVPFTVGSVSRFRSMMLAC